MPPAHEITSPGMCVLHAVHEHKLDDAEGRINDHEQRIRVLERATLKMSAVVATVAALASLAGAYLGTLK